VQELGLSILSGRTIHTFRNLSEVLLTQILVAFHIPTHLGAGIAFSSTAVMFHKYRLQPTVLYHLNISMSH
jgi:hypothetical protein